MNEPSWIPSIRGSTHTVFILKFLFDAFVMFALASAGRTRVLALARYLTYSRFPRSKYLIIFQLLIFFFLVIAVFPVQI